MAYGAKYVAHVCMDWQFDHHRIHEWFDSMAQSFRLYLLFLQIDGLLGK